MPAKKVNYCLITALGILIGTYSFSGLSSAGTPHTKPMIPGQIINDFEALSYENPPLIGRLSDRAYWVAIKDYSSTVYVGDKGVLVIDPLSRGMGAKLLEAVSQITNLPITMVVYSHSHLDHASDIDLFVEHAKKSGQELNLVGTEAFVNQTQRFAMDLPEPNIKVTVPYGEFFFEKTKISVYTPEAFSHTPDTSMFLIKRDRIVHWVDIVQARDIPYVDFGGGVDPKALEDQLKHALSLEWDFLVTGHGHVAYKDDVKFDLDYISDVRTATAIASEKISYKEFSDPDLHHYQVFNAFMDALAEDVYMQIESKYGHYSGLRAVLPGHVKLLRVQRSLFGY